MIIRRMRVGDIDQVLAIEELSFKYPWSRKTFEIELVKDFGISLVAVVNDKVVGYLIEWLIADEIHIANLAVHPEWRGKGIAKTLIQKGIINDGNFSRVRLEVRYSNIPARSLYAKLGFTEIGIEKGYYVQDNEDAIIMVKRLKTN